MKTPHSDVALPNIEQQPRVDSEPEKGEIFRAEYVSAVEKFALKRGHEIAGRLVFMDEDAKKVGMAHMRALYNLLDPIDGAEPVDDSVESICTVTVPVAILKEDIDAVVSGIEKIKRSQRDSDKPLDIILWANAKYDMDNKPEVEEKSLELYSQLVEKLGPLHSDTFRIKTALQLIQPIDSAISHVRANYMDAVAIDLLKRGYGSNHPIMWIDADTTNISKGSIETLASIVRNGDALFAHANLQYGIDWAPDTSLDDLDDATKAVIFNEFQQRQLGALTDDVIAPEHYDEESGLAFTIGVYLNAGGVITDDPINESAHLINQALGVAKSDTHHDWDRTPGMKYVKSARLGTSARRHYEVAKQSGALGLSKVDAVSYGNRHFAEKVDTGEAVPITKGDLYDLYNVNDEKWKRRTRHTPGKSQLPYNLGLIGGPRDRNRTIAHRLIERYFSE